MTNGPPLFEEMLDTYPANKRELARRVYDRFANGDATEFFAQLFLLLDVYANYAKQIPQAVSETNQSTLAAMKKVREEVGLLAQNVESRSVGLDNRFQETNELCVETQEKCEAAMREAADMIAKIAQMIDTNAIVDSVQKSVDAGVNERVIRPFMRRSEELAKSVLPTLKEIKHANEEAAQVWPGRIWKMALGCGLAVGLAVAAVVIWGGYFTIKGNYEQTLAEQIAETTGVTVQNRKVFDDLAVAGAAIYLARSSEANGNTTPSGFCLYIKGAQAVDLHEGEGRIFFLSPRSESELKSLHRATEQAVKRMGQ